MAFAHASEEAVVPSIAAAIVAFVHRSAYSADLSAGLFL